ncbi:hypothetical protein H9Y04_19840 [Streptomyces sp. TRM66268-LWL]|uniref:Uncharacterized protein n=1 Tax=Streptomyces polyasparticus TaxID=2767826 RepID=A0ABR7SKF5_9ACTN|nr:hypothetical protein [Streptomyces polyasparticus]MBC9714808.1 hypothetical protein [Streptomyces polyasparticus]
MCSRDLADKEAAIAQFLLDYPQAADAGRGHPALRGCEDVRWSAFPECPAAIPVLLHGLLDPAAAFEAKRVLTNSLLNSVREMNAAMPAALPFLLRLASDPRIPAQSRLLSLVVSVAGFSEPIDGRNEAMVYWFGSDCDHPEREQCRAVFAEHASVVAELAEHLSSPDDRAQLRRVAGLL